MILFVNVFLTDMGFSKFDRGLLPNYDPIDVFKYTMASYSVINWSNVIIYYDVEEKYKQRVEEIDTYIYSLFQHPIIYHFRNEWQIQWKVAMTELFSFTADELVWYTCNHDHVFIDSDLYMITSIEKKLNDLSSQFKYVSCMFSHWLTQFHCKKLKFIQDEKGSYYKKTEIIEDNKDYFVYKGNSTTSLQIVNKCLLYHWWFENNYGDAWMPRSDTSSPGRSVKTLTTASLSPYKEIVRHFDGDAHVHLSLNIGPPLFIPEGFFYNDIKILYCKSERKKGYVHINPFIENYSTIDANGADMKCVLEDTPLFWKNRISTIEVGPHDENMSLIKRNEEVKKLASQQPFLFGRVPMPPKKEMIPIKDELDNIISIALRSKTDLLKEIQKIKAKELLPQNNVLTVESNIIDSLVKNEIEKTSSILKKMPGKIYSRLLFTINCFTPDYFSSYVDNLMKQGETFYSIQKIEKSIFIFLELLYYDIENVLAWNNLGVALEKINLRQEAMASLNHGLTLTTNSRCLFNKAILMNKNNQNSKELLEELLNNQKRMQNSYQFIGEIRYKFSQLFQKDKSKMDGKLKWLSQITKRGKDLTNVG